MSAVTTLSDELDKLRKNICHDCKKRLVPGSRFSSCSLNWSYCGIFTLASAPFWRRMFQGRLPSHFIDRLWWYIQLFTNSQVPTNNTSEIIHQTTVNTPAMNSGFEQTPSSPEPKSELPEFSVVYNPEVNRALHLHLAHVFTHESPAICVKTSPDGQRIAVGYSGSGKTVINEVKTRSNVRSVSGCFVRNLD